MAAKKSGRHPVFNILVLAVVCILAFFFFLNLGGAVGSVRGVSVPLTSVTVWNVTEPLRQEDLIWSEEDIPPFYIFNMGREMGPMKDSLLGDCIKGLPEAYCHFLFNAPQRVYEKKQARVFLVPIFESALYRITGLHEAAKGLYNARYFMKFRGSDFVFICYTRDCASTKRVVLDGLGKAARAMWVDRGGEEAWPCENRKITVAADAVGDMEVSDFVEESRRIQYVLKRASELVEGRQRWECSSSDSWGMHHPTIFDFNTIKDTSFKSVNDEVAYCGVPKVGSSVAVLLMRRMNDMDDWKKSNTLQIRNFKTDVNWTYKGTGDMLEIFDQTHWVKGMLVRNPITRLLSGYRSKIEDLREYKRVPGGWPQSRSPPPLKTFVELIKRGLAKGKNFDWMDRHFRPQSALCGVRTLPFDFIGRYEDRAEDMHDWLKSLGLWEKLGASGWGPEGLSALYTEDEQIMRRKKLKPVTHADSKDIVRQYYTRDLVKTVIELYEEDFTRFGYSKNPDDYI